jgi:glutaredoxin
MKALYRSLYLKSQIKIMGRESCAYCKKSKELLDTYNLKYIYEEVGDPATFAYETVPQIWLNDTHIGGYSDLKNIIEAILNVTIDARTV